MADSPFFLAYIGLAALVAVGLTMLFVGYLATVAAAFGNNQWVWGIATLVISPLALVFCLRHPNVASWPRGLLLKGLAITIGAFCGAFLLASTEPSKPAPPPQGVGNVLPPAQLAAPVPNEELLHFAPKR
jgi:hypothetical protein